MTRTLELAAFTVREDAEPALLAERPEMVAAFTAPLPGCAESKGLRHVEVTHEEVGAHPSSSKPSRRHRRLPS